MSNDECVIVGAGIIGVYTAYSLITYAKVPASKITIAAEFQPGDESIRYTSPYAGGNFSCISPDDAPTRNYDRFTYTQLDKLRALLSARNPEFGLDIYECSDYWDYIPGKAKIASLSSYLRDYKVIEQLQLPEGAKFGINYFTWNFNCPKFLKAVLEYLKAEGVVVLRQKFDHIEDALSVAPNASYVFNCTGLGSRELGGVNDKKTYPARGQVVVIKTGKKELKQNFMRWGKNDTATYIIPRPHSNGQVVLGGFLQKYRWEPATFEAESRDIIQRVSKLCPQLLTEYASSKHEVDGFGKLDVIRVVSGWRPSREGGVRIERENFVKNAKERVLVHNYGAGGYGYQSGLGMSFKAVTLAFPRAGDFSDYFNEASQSKL
ncbi:hypothetical protein BABINDRAFT_175331 [Babjeviella inositovora NRRL Y-12698]|uniref:FAD dependent oxidoreductase domain-containing protein n=1 Tax=Babjeviella inositovora NRRL Y-12698 TaxID=984486 RepID=A0A1E3QSP0_9ASCO|nr:uncharacterized protein BABINDRAFT_175331 [Babjeviella inositovora NRRL Y-12698]ODQ80658.1 hypothetical protein BABINDRAFT_175331 [Babjeviella inositovora NRRL Y-12698]